MKRNKVVYGWFNGEECFYIGVGDIRRPYKKNSRNPHCKNKRDKAERENTFQIKILFNNLTQSEAHEIEVQLIQQYGRIDLGTGCLTNMTDGGEGLVSPSKETREKISSKQKGISCPSRNYWKGKERNVETKRKISKSLTGKTRSQESIEKQRSNNSGDSNYLSIAVVTPLGRFSTMSKAAKAHKRSRDWIRRRAESNSYMEYYYE